MKINKNLSKEQLEAIRKSKSVRRSLAYDSHLMFFIIYLPHYIRYPSAPFHYKMFELTEDNKILNAALTAFRDSGKSAVNTTSNPIWSIIGSQKKKLVLIASQTQSQAKKHLSNVRKELEGNQRLIDDIGPFKEESTQWTADTLVLTEYDARIMAVSTEQSIRGIRHGAYRPDLIICDDVEDSNSVKTREGRDKTWDWYNSEIVPTGSKNTKTLVVGNLLHEDSLIMRLKKAGIKYFEYPLIDDNKNILWPGKFPTWKDIEILKSTIPSEEAWYREYLLKIISDKDRVVHREWIQTYKDLPDEGLNSYYLFTVTAVDPAISKNSYASYTAIITAEVWRVDGEIVIYILPNPVNKRLSFPEAISTLKQIADIRLKIGKPTETVIESVSSFQAIAQQLMEDGLYAVQVPAQKDKRERLSLITPWIQNGKVLFPEKGAERIIEQITGFGIENYDDLADALSLLVLHVMGKASDAREKDSDGISGPASINFSEFGMGKIWDMKF